MRIPRLAMALAGLFCALPAAASDLPGLSIPNPGGGIGGGWYLRGDIGYSQPASERLQVMRLLIDRVEDYSSSKLSNQATFGLGVGWHVLPWLRIDGTIEHRANSRLVGQYSAIGDPTIAREDSSAKFSATTGLLNAYVDLGTWSGITPYVGAGAGVAQVKLADYSGTVTVTPAAPFWGTGLCPAAPVGQNETCASATVLGAKKQNNFAWAVMAGAAVEVTPQVKLDFGYRFIHYGTVAMSPDPFGITIRLKDVQAHEVRLGLRYLFGAGPHIPQVVTARN